MGKSKPDFNRPDNSLHRILDPSQKSAKKRLKVKKKDLPK